MASFPSVLPVPPILLLRSVALPFPPIHTHISHTQSWLTDYHMVACYAFPDRVRKTADTMHRDREEAQQRQLAQCTNQTPESPYSSNPLCVLLCLPSGRRRSHVRCRYVRIGEWHSIIALCSAGGGAARDGDIRHHRSMTGRSGVEWRRP